MKEAATASQRKHFIGVHDVGYCHGHGEDDGEDYVDDDGDCGGDDDGDCGGDDGGDCGDDDDDDCGGDDDGDNCGEVQPQSRHLSIGIKRAIGNFPTSAPSAAKMRRN